MASIVRYAGRLRRIEFVPGRGQPRRAVRLGAVSQKVAASWKAKIEAILADKLMNRPHDAELAAWIAGLDEKMLARLRKAGLADGVGLAQTTLTGLMDRYFAAMTCKPQTRVFYRHTRRCLEAFLGAARPLRDIGPGDADAWRAWLAEHEKLAPATVSRRIVAARTMWRAAVRWKLASENPFEGIKAGHQSNEDRKRFVPQEVIDRAIAEVPDTEWKCIIALARYGGLRCPSEHFALRWADVNWERGEISVTVPKLAHIEGRGRRTIPLFAELREHLLTLFEEAEPGTEYVISKHRLGSANLRQQFKRILARAGITPWPRLFQNLRASRETELMREYDLATAAKWIGNSPEIAARHYATSVDLDSDFRRAAGLGTEAQQKAQQSASVGNRPRATADSARYSQTGERAGKVNTGLVGAIADETSHCASMGRAGIEPARPFRDKGF